MERFSVVADPRDGLVPVDVDVHGIPGRLREPAHDHHDIRFLLLAGEGQDLRISSESNALRWVDPSALQDLGADESLLRLARKARRRLDLALG
jgi:hypothetical protein